MSSGQHLSRELYDLIKAIGETRSKQEEDKIITNEVAILKSKIGEKDIQSKKMKEFMIRSIYIEMLGHDASFSYIHAVNLTQSKILSIKRIGYLACNLFLNEDSEFILLLVATLQRDLASANPQEVIVALNSLCKLVCPTVVHALVEPVVKLLNHPHEIVRKKAVMAMMCIQKMSANSIPDYTEKMKKALCDTNPSVMGATLNLYYDAIKENSTKYKELVGSFVVILKQIIDHKLPKDFDYHRIPAPWIQIKLLRILALLGENDQKTSEQIYEILGQTMKRADDTGTNIGCAITYQCVKTISRIYPSQSLLETAASSVSRLLTSEHNNLKYLGINALISIVQVNPKYAMDHQIVIVDCLESTDETLKRETLELLYRITNGGNVDAIVDKLIIHLKASADPHFKKDLVNKIISLSERFAPSQEWFIKTMNIILEYGSEFVEQKTLTNLLRLIEENFQINGETFGKFLIQIYLGILQTKTILPDQLIKIMSWVIGEFGHKLYDTDSNKLEELSQALSKALEVNCDNDLTKGWILNSLAKLSVCTNFNSLAIYKKALDQYSRSQVLDLQRRAGEYRLLANYAGALSDAASLKVDCNLSFLEGYVQESLRKGAKPYDKSKLSSNISTLLISSQVPETTVELNYQPYKQQTISNDADKQKGSGIRVQSNQKPAWTTEGYVKPEKPAPNPFAGMDKKNQQGIGSNEFLGGTGKSIKGPFTGTGSGPVNPKDIFPAPLPKKTEIFDANLKEKEVIANQLFKGLDMGLGTSKLTTTLQKQSAPTTSTTNVSIAQNTNVNQQPKPQPASTSIDLLDLDFDTVPTTTTIPQTTVFPQPVSNSNIFAGMSAGIKPQLGGDINTGSNQFQPLNINLEQFEQLWTNIQEEHIENIYSSKITTEIAFRDLAKNINFKVIEVIGNEVICSSKHKSTNEDVLLYGSYDTKGNLEIRLKSKRNNLINDVVKNIRENSTGSTSNTTGLLNLF